VLGKTHLFYGLTAGAAAVVALIHPVSMLPLAASVATGAVGGLLPDLDEPGSTISNAPRMLGKQAQHLLRRATGGTALRVLGLIAGALIGLLAGILNLVSRALSHLVRFVSGGHREGTHWLPVWVGLSAGVFALMAPLVASGYGLPAAVGFGAGYLSHLVGDGLTRSGLPLVPYTGARLHLLPRPLRVRTGTGGEVVATILYTVLLVAALYELFVTRTALVRW
jgi:hypothetical protein